MNFKMEDLCKAIKNGERDLVEQLLNQEGICSKLIERSNRPCRTQFFLRDCVQFTHKKPEDDILKRIQIAHLLVGINPCFLEKKDELGRTPLLSQDVHPQLLLELIKLGADPLVYDESGSTICHMSKDRGHLKREEYHSLITSLPPEKLRKLLTVKNKHEVPPIGLVTWHMDPLPETLDLFKAVGVDFNFRSKWGDWYLTMVAMRGRSAATLLKSIECGSNVLARDARGYTLLHYYADAASSTPEEYHKLIEGIPPNHFKKLIEMKNEDNDTPLGRLVYLKDPLNETLDVYKREGADFNNVNKHGRPILAMASYGGRSPSTLLKLIECGADPLDKDRRGNSILHSYSHDALSVQYHSLIHSIPEKTFKALTGVTNCFGDTPLGCILEKMDPLPGTLDIFKGTGTDFNHINKDGDSILGVAALYGRKVDTILNLIKCGSDVLWRDRNGGNILHLYSAPQEEYLNLVRGLPKEILRELVAKCPEELEGPLVCLLQRDDPHPDTLAEFAAAGADFNDTNEKGYPILIVAIQNGRSVETLRKLVECGANVHWRKRWRRKNLLHYAAQAGNSEAIEFLVTEQGLSVTSRTWILRTPRDYAKMHQKRTKDEKARQTLEMLAGK